MPSLDPSTAHFVFWLAAVACGIAQGTILWFAVRRFDAAGRAYEEDRRGPERRGGERWSPDRRRDPHTGPSSDRTGELLWSLLPAVALMILLAATWAALP